MKNVKAWAWTRRLWKQNHDHRWVGWTVGTIAGDTGPSTRFSSPRPSISTECVGIDYTGCRDEIALPFSIRASCWIKGVTNVGVYGISFVLRFLSHPLKCSKLSLIWTSTKRTKFNEHGMTYDLISLMYPVVFDQLIVHKIDSLMLLYQLDNKDERCFHVIASVLRLYFDHGRGDAVCALSIVSCPFRTSRPASAYPENARLRCLAGPNKRDRGASDCDGRSGSGWCNSACSSIVRWLNMVSFPDINSSMDNTLVSDVLVGLEGASCASVSKSSVSDSVGGGRRLAIWSAVIFCLSLAR
jgi:hypothetical protein